MNGKDISPCSGGTCFDFHAAPVKGAPFSWMESLLGFCQPDPAFLPPGSVGKSPNIALGVSPQFGDTRVWLKLSTFATVAEGQMRVSYFCSGGRTGSPQACALPALASEKS